MKKLSSRINSIGIGNIILFCGIIIALDMLIMKIYDFLPNAITYFTVGLGFIAIGIAKNSDERMQAMANLEYREKMAMMWKYWAEIESSGMAASEANIKRITCDYESALELEKWIDKKLKAEMTDTITKIRDGLQKLKSK